MFTEKMKQFALKTNAAENLFGVYLMIITYASLAPYIFQIPGFCSSDVFSFCFVNYKRCSRIYVSALRSYFHTYKHLYNIHITYMYLSKGPFVIVSTCDHELRAVLFIILILCVSTHRIYFVI